MCIPAIPAIAAMTAPQLATAALVIGGVSAIAQANAAVETASNKNKQYYANVQSAKDAYFLKTKQSNLRIQQEQARTVQQKMDADLPTSVSLSQTLSVLRACTTTVWTNAWKTSHSKLR